MNNKSHRFYYGWVIVGVTFITLFLALGTRFSFGIFYVAILGEYGWGRGETAGAYSLAMIVHASFALVTGFLIDRFSPRRLFPLGATLLLLGLIAASRIHTIWHLYLCFGVFIAIGINIIGFGPHMALIPRWFVQKRGLASGLALSGIGIGALVILPLTELIIESMGWRSAFLVLAGIILCVIIPTTAIFQRRSPAEVGQYPDGLDLQTGVKDAAQREGPPKMDRAESAPQNWTFGAALRTGAFWWIGVVVFSHGFSANMLLVHQTVHVVDSGFSQLLAASLLGLVGLLMSAGGILFGFLSDRVGREVGFTLGSGAALLGLLLFLFVRNTSAPWILYAFAILYGLGQGGLGPIYSSTMGDLFAGPSLGRIIATVSIEYGLGGALGAYLGGYFYDTVGSYFVPFTLSLACIGLGIFGIWMAAPRHPSPLIDKTV
ncbi:MAG: MFS transporter [Desulfobacteraceae bacterium]